MVGIRTHGTVTRTTVFETVSQAQIGTGGKVDSRWLQARDLNLHLDFQERMIAADSLLRLASSPMVASLQRHLTTAAVEGRTRGDWITAPDICWSSTCQESCGFARQGAC